MLRGLRTVSGKVRGKIGIPAYQRIQGAIRRSIETGKLKPGDVVDSERELAKAHSVSLMTARHALKVLENEGLVERRRGAGTFVAPPKTHFNKLMGFTEMMSSRGMTACSKVLVLDVVANEEVAARLSLPSAARLLRVERLRRGGGVPLALETCYLPAANFPGLAEAPLEHASLFSVLERDYGVELAYADEEIDTTAADSRTAGLLSIQREAPLLRVRQILVSTRGTPTAYVLGQYRSDRHTLLVRRFR